MSSRQERRLIFYVSAAHGSVHMVELTYAALLGRIGDEFGAGLFLLGAVANAAALAFGLSALPAGVLVDRLGARRVLQLAFAGSAVLALLVALSPNLWLLTVTLTALGLTTGLYHPAGVSLIARLSRQRGLALGYHGVVGNLGTALAPAVAIGVAVAADWRWSYGLMAVLALLFLGVVQFGRFIPRETLPGERRATDQPAAPPHPSQPVHWLPLLMVYAILVLNGFIYRGSLTFLPTHMEEHVRISLWGIDSAAIAGSLTTLALLTGAAGQYAGGALSQRVPLARLAVPLTALVAPALLLMGAGEGLLLVIAAAGFVFFNFSAQPVFTGLIADYSPAGRLGRSLGVSFFVSFGIGSFAGSLAGLVAERWGTGSVFFLLAGLAAATLALAVGVWRLASRAEASQRLAAEGSLPDAPA